MFHTELVLFPRDICYLKLIVFFKEKHKYIFLRKSDNFGMTCTKENAPAYTR